MNLETKNLDARYFNWLCKLVGAKSNRNPAQSHVLLAEQMFKTQFNDSTPNDFNRSLDGVDLRHEFLEEKNIHADQEWLDMDCSILEMLIGLARRLAFHSGWSVSSSFWEMITNIELEKYTDEKYHDGIAEAVDFSLDMLNSRTYDRNGRGGLFPLESPANNQRKVEIWYQMSAYILENVKF